MELLAALALLALFGAGCWLLARYPAERVLEQYAVDELARRDARVAAERELAQAEVDARRAADVERHNAIAAAEAEHRAKVARDVERLTRGVVQRGGLPVSASGNRVQRRADRAEARRAARSGRVER